jgi:hypothetical protein
VITGRQSSDDWSSTRHSPLVDLSDFRPAELSDFHPALTPPLIDQPITTHRSTDHRSSIDRSLGVGRALADDRSCMSLTQRDLTGAANIRQEESQRLSDDHWITDRRMVIGPRRPLVIPLLTTAGLGGAR